MGGLPGLDFCISVSIFRHPLMPFASVFNLQAKRLETPNVTGDCQEFLESLFAFLNVEYHRYGRFGLLGSCDSRDNYVSVLGDSKRE